MEAQIIELFSTKQAAQLAGLSTGMIDYLCRAKILTPSKTGSRGRSRGRGRRYSFGDVVLLRTYAMLLRSGVSVKRIREAQKTWSRHFNTLDRQTLPARFLLTDGKHVLLREADNVLADLNADGQLTFSFIVDLHQVRAEVLQAIAVQHR